MQNIVSKIHFRYFWRIVYIFHIQPFKRWDEQWGIELSEECRIHNEWRN